MMKWWGWGAPDFKFPMEKKPLLWPWIKARLGLVAERSTPPVARSTISLSAPRVDPEFAAAIGSFLEPEQIQTSDDERLLHAYGKSFPDLWRVRRGEIRRAPDMVLLPQSHEQVARIVSAAARLDVSVIPFGGGTNIVGGIEHDSQDPRMAVTIDMRRMDRLLELDPLSATALIEAGALGPQVERQLNARGWSLGHFPDSFEYSSLGGWIATRSAGMQSDEYGKIEDMIVSLRMVSPDGEVKTRAVPASSAGPDLNRMISGSEGTFGVITEAVMRVHPVPEVKDYRGFLLRSFEDGVNAIRRCYAEGHIPSMCRLQDAAETELAFNMKAPPTGLSAWVQKPIKAWLKNSGYSRPAILILGLEGGAARVKFLRGKILPILKSFGAFPLGKGVGGTWSQDKFNIPYLRDYLLDRGITADVAETSALWGALLPLYRGVCDAVEEKFRQDGLKGYLGCHLSHSYKTGACLYFTVAFPQDRGRELDQYYDYKRFITDAFMRLGATLSHHHAVGVEHRPWMEAEVSPAGLRGLRALKGSLDPRGIMNPGKLLPDPSPAPSVEA